MRCDYEPVCPFYKRKSKVTDEQYMKFTSKYCADKFKDCAVFTVIDEANFLAVPLDLMPDQNHRVYLILLYSGQV